MPIKTGEVDRPGQSLFGVKIGGGPGGGQAAVPGEQQAAQGTVKTVLAGAKI